MKYYADLAAALTDMEMSELRDRGGADIEDVTPIVTDYEMYIPDAEGERAVAAQAEFYPNEVQYTMSIEEQAEAVKNKLSRALVQFDECAVAPAEESKMTMTAEAPASTGIKEKVANASLAKILGGLFLAYKFLPTNAFLGLTAATFFIRSEKNKSLEQIAKEANLGCSEHLG